MTIELKTAALKALDERGEGAAVFAIWDVEDADQDIFERGSFGRQERFMIAHHQMQSGQPPLAKGFITEEAAGPVYRFRMNLELEQARNWHKHLLFDLTEGLESQQKWSFGFRPMAGGWTPRPGSRGRRFHATPEGGYGVHVLEVSPVVAAAQPLSHTLTAKTAGVPLTPAEQAELRDMFAVNEARLAEAYEAEQHHLRFIFLHCLAGHGR